MKLAIGLEENNYNSKIDKRFGRASYFLIIDSETKEYEIIENDAKEEVTGAGIKVVKKLAQLGVEGIIIAGEIGPKAETLIKEFDIPVYKVENPTTVENLLEEYSQNNLKKYNFSSENSGLRMA